jgi:cyclophilin family peptidyl-prolyl cis-trans isomerase
MNYHLTLWIDPCIRRLVSGGCGLAMAVMTVALWGQTPNVNEPPPERVRPETAELKQATDALREHLKKMREVLVLYNTNLTNDLDKSSLSDRDRQLKQQWFELERAGLPLHAKLHEAALAEYLMDPEKKTAIADMLWRLLERNSEIDYYEGMLPIAQALLANNYRQEKLLPIATMTAFATCDFDALRPMLNQLVVDGNAPPMLIGLQQDLARVEQLWQAELAARQQDAQGEPLPRVVMHTTKGDIEIELFEDQAPETVGNFVHLIESGFYEGLTFHRVIEHFMAQTGCPTGDGTGGPGYTVYNESHKPGARNFFRGTLGLALAQEPNTGGSQFFITYLPTYQLNEGFTAFGRVISGMHVVSNLERINPEEKKEEGEPAPIPDEIISIEVLRKRDHEYTPHKVRQ